TGRRRNASAPRRAPATRSTPRAAARAPRTSPSPIGEERGVADQPPDADEMPPVVGGVERRDAHRAARRRRMHETAVAEIDADVREVALVLEEDEVARARRLERYLLGRLEQVDRVARHREPGARVRV